ncbi:MAG: hypothetical protein ACOYL9_06585 [Ilumatobacteraceae bacterium]
MNVTTFSSPVLRRLQHEWLHLRTDRRSIRAARSWQLRIAPFDSLDEVLVAAGFGPTRPGAHDDDAVLGELVAIAHDDELASRIVLQRILPGVASIARRRARCASHRADLTDDLVAAAWTVIRTYPIDRRPDYVAANLLRSIEYEVFRRFERRLTTFIPVPTDTFDVAVDVAPPHALVELAAVVRDAHRAGMDGDDLDLVRRLARGESTVEIAAALGLTDRAIRYRRAAVTGRLAALSRIA